jgi:hypothetical protein
MVANCGIAPRSNCTKPRHTALSGDGATRMRVLSGPLPATRFGAFCKTYASWLEGWSTTVVARAGARPATIEPMRRARTDGIDRCSARTTASFLGRRLRHRVVVGPAVQGQWGGLGRPGGCAGDGFECSVCRASIPRSKDSQTGKSTACIVCVGDFLRHDGTARDPHLQGAPQWRTWVPCRAANAIDQAPTRSRRS